jgi:hypothetical protein
MQNARLHDLWYPVGSAFGQTLPALFGQRMLVQSLYRIRGTLRGTVAGRYAHGERRYGKENDNGAGTSAP